MLTDSDPRVLKLLQRNAWQCEQAHASGGKIHVLPLEWGSKTQLESVLENAPGGFEVVLISDCNYDVKTISKLWKSARALINPETGKLYCVHESRSKRIDEVHLHDLAALNS